MKRNDLWKKRHHFPILGDVPPFSSFYSGFCQKFLVAAVLGIGLDDIFVLLWGVEWSFVLKKNGDGKKGIFSSF